MLSSAYKSKLAHFQGIQSLSILDTRLHENNQLFKNLKKKTERSCDGWASDTILANKIIFQEKGGPCLILAFGSLGLRIIILVLWHQNKVCCVQI